MKNWLIGLIIAAIAGIAIWFKVKAEPEPEPLPVYYCPFCSAQFSTLAELRKHIKEEHPDAEAYFVLTNLRIEPNKMLEGQTCNIRVMVTRIS